MLMDVEFALIAAEAKARTGQMLGKELAGAVDMRLQPLSRREGFASVSELIAAARIRPDGRLWNAIADQLILCETRFFRDRAMFERLRADIIPSALARRGQERVRIWSAACSTGQEPYSLAMTIEDMRAEGLNPAVEIVATDCSDRLLEKARSGLYTQFEIQRGLPIRKLIAHFEKSGDLWRLSDRLRASVRFENHNLLKHAGHLGQFDIVLLRSVLNGFDAETRAAIIHRTLDVLHPEGCIVVDAGETLAADGLVIDRGVITRSTAARRAA
jgi:chemotaxis protein methyltransferase CheR